MTAPKFPAHASAGAWPRAVPLVVVLGVLLWLFRETAQSMVSIWSRSDTFAHAFLVPPIALALVWRKRAELARTAAAPSPLWLLALVLACAVWLLGNLAAVHSAAQGALVALVVCAVPAVLGVRAARVIAFPLLFLFFSVPIGEFLIEPMMEGTADFTVAALRASGIPVYREGLQFVIPSGNWSVVAACSGVRYLIASVMVGTLFAYLNFHSWKRRLAFVALAIVVPVVANWLRAYLIVMLGHLSSNQIAAGADHLVYGWIFFGVVILLMFMVGARFVDAAPAPTAGKSLSAGDMASVPAAARRGVWIAAASACFLLLGTQVVHERIHAASAVGVPVFELPADLPATDQGSKVAWQAGRPPITDWMPFYRHAATVAHTTYAVRGGAREDAVGVWVGLYRDQNYERKMITSTNVLVEEGSMAWLALVQPAAHMVLEGLGRTATVAPRSTLLRAPADPRVSPTQRLLVWRLYRVGGRWVSGDAEALVWLALQRLLGRGDDSAVLMFYSPLAEDERGAERLQTFVSHHLDVFAERIDAARAGRAGPTR